MRDLSEIFSWSKERFGRAQAERYLRALRARADAAHVQPSLGRPFEPTPGVRRVASGSHHIYYREIDTGIRVLRVLHQRMLQDVRLN